jgi:hypothetical protein
VVVRAGLGPVVEILVDTLRLAAEALADRPVRIGREGRLDAIVGVGVILQPRAAVDFVHGAALDAGIELKDRAVVGAEQQLGRALPVRGARRLIVGQQGDERMRAGGDGQGAVVFVDDLGLVLGDGRGRDWLGEVGELLDASPAALREFIGPEPGLQRGHFAGLEPERGVRLLRRQHGHGGHDEAGVAFVEPVGCRVTGVAGQAEAEEERQEAFHGLGRGNV